MPSRPQQIADEENSHNLSGTQSAPRHVQNYTFSFVLNHSTLSALYLPFNTQHNHDAAFGILPSINDVAMPGPTYPKDDTHWNLTNGIALVGGANEAAHVPRETTPEGHISQDDDWPQAGRFFSIWATEDHEIHQKMFILLECRRNDGLGVLVQQPTEEGVRQIRGNTSSPRTHMRLLGPNNDIGTSAGGSNIATNRILTAKLENARHDFTNDSYILLQHTYNIPFLKCKFEDHGILDAESLEDVRFRYLLNAGRVWGVEKRLKEHYK